MAKWKDIGKLSAKDEKGREAAFEAAMMAELAKNQPPKPQTTAPAAPPVIPQASAPPSGITITVTENGKTATYSRLEDVPVEVRQRIVGSWLAAPGR